MNEEDKKYYYGDHVYRRIIVPINCACLSCAFSEERVDCNALMRSGIIDSCVDWGNTGDNTVVYQRVEKDESTFLNII